MKYLYKLLKKVLISFGLLYSYNLLMGQYNVPIPINIITIAITTILGIPGFIGLVIFYLINY